MLFGSELNRCPWRPFLGNPTLFRRSLVHYFRVQVRPSVVNQSAPENVATLAGIQEIQQKGRRPSNLSFQLIKDPTLHLSVHFSHLILNLQQLLPNIYAINKSSYMLSTIKPNKGSTTLVHGTCRARERRVYPSSITERNGILRPSHLRQGSSSSSIKASYPLSSLNPRILPPLNFVMTHS